MNRDLATIFKDTTEAPNPSLSMHIWSLVCAREARVIRIKSWCYATVGVLSLGWLIVAVKELAKAFTQSGFYEYLSLAFSDGGAVVSYWKEFALTLADSLPVTSIILCLVAVFMLLVSIKQGARQFKNQLSVAY